MSQDVIKTVRTLLKEKQHLIRVIPNHPLLSSFTIQNTREYQEDRFDVRDMTIHHTHYLLLTICDGHGGAHSSEYCIHLFPSLVEDMLKHNKHLPIAELLRQALLETIDQYDKITVGNTLRTMTDKDLAKLGRQLKSKKIETAGTTLATILIDITHRLAWAMSLGDSRIGWFVGDIYNQTPDQKPDPYQPLVHRFIVAKDRYGEYRVQPRNGDGPRINLSSSVGDNHPGLLGCMKRTPTLTPIHFENQEFRCVVGSDGFWDAQKVAPKLMKRLLQMPEMFQMKESAALFTDFAKERVHDNVTVITCYIR